MIEDLPDPHIRVIDRYIEALNKAQTKELRGRPEYTVLQHPLEGKIGFELRVINGIGSPPHLLAVVKPVPCRRAKTPPSLSITCWMSASSRSALARAAGAIRRIKPNASAGEAAI